MHVESPTSSVLHDRGPRLVGDGVCWAVRACTFLGAGAFGVGLVSDVVVGAKRAVGFDESPCAAAFVVGEPGCDDLCASRWGRYARGGGGS